MSGFYNYDPYMPHNYMAMGNQPVRRGLQISYVNGLTGAKGYSIPPDTTIFLMDSDAPRFYIKTSDHNGMCTIKGFQFEEIRESGGEEAPTIDMSNYVTKTEMQALFDAWAAQLKEQVQINKGGLL